MLSLPDTAGYRHMGRLFEELKRRNVFRVAIAYAIVAWLILQVADVVLPTFQTPGWVMPAFTFLLALGFPLALIFAWAFELTPEGIKPEKEIDRSESITHGTGRKLDFIIIGVLAVAVVVFAVDKFVLAPDSASVDSEIQRSVAVLPFVDMSPDKDQEYFSEGIAEELLNQLTKLHGLHVAGRTSSFSFKDTNEDLRVIGEKLNVAHILEGSVRKAGNRVRITVQLVKASDGFHLWSQTYDRDLNDIFAIQEETAKAVANALSITLGFGEIDFGAGGTRNFEAYDAYLAGNSLFGRFGSESAVRAIEQLEKAVALDPEYADAWSALANIYQVSANFFIAEQTEELFKKSEAAASRAIEIAPDAISSLIVVSQLQTRRREWTAVEQSLQKALELAPVNFWANLEYGFFFMTVGQTREAVVHFRRASRTEPLSLLPVQNVAFAHETIGDFDTAMQEYERGKELIGTPAILNSLVFVLAMEMGDRALIDEYLQKLVNDDPGPRETWPLTTTMQSLLDSPEAARAELHNFYSDPAFDFPLTHSAIAAWASHFDDHEFALKIHHELFEARRFVVYSIWRYIHKEMRQLPAFKDLARDLGLVDYWRNTGNWGDFCHPLGEDDFECK